MISNLLIHTKGISKLIRLEIPFVVNILGNIPSIIQIYPFIRNKITILTKTKCNSHKLSIIILIID